MICHAKISGAKCLQSGFGGSDYHFKYLKSLDALCSFIKLKNLMRVDFVKWLIKNGAKICVSFVHKTQSPYTVILQLKPLSLNRRIWTRSNFAKCHGHKSQHSFKALSAFCQNVDRSAIYGVDSQTLTVCRNADLVNDRLGTFTTRNQQLIPKVSIFMEKLKPNNVLVLQ